MDPSFCVRQMAEEALTQVTRAGDKRIIAVLLARLDLPDCSDRRVVLKTLAGIGQDAEGSETLSNEPFCSTQLTWDEGLGLVVVEGLAKFTLQDPNGGVIALCTCLEDLLPQVRQMAGQALGEVAQQSLDESIYVAIQKEVSKRLRRSHGEMKLDALQALVKTVNHGDIRGILAVSQCLEDPFAEVREAAVLALAQIAPVGHAGAMAAIRERLRHSRFEVRQSANEALRAVQEGFLPKIAGDNGCNSDSPQITLPLSTLGIPFDISSVSTSVTRCCEDMSLRIVTPRTITGTKCHWTTPLSWCALLGSE